MKQGQIHDRQVTKRHEINQRQQVSTDYSCLSYHCIIDLVGVILCVKINHTADSQFPPISQLLLICFVPVGLSMFAPDEETA